MNLREYPTPWQRKTLWAAATAFAVVLIGAIAVGLIWITSQVLGFLQPILIPFAIAGVLAYLLDPVVEKIESWGTTRNRAVIAVFAILTLTLIGIALWVVPAISEQTGNLVRKVPKYSVRVTEMVLTFAHDVQEKTGLRIFPDLPPVPEVPTGPNPGLKEIPPATGPATTTGTAAPSADAPKPDDAPPADAAPPESSLGLIAARPVDLKLEWQRLVSGQWVQTTLPGVLKNIWTFITSSVGGFLGVFGFLLSMIIVPVYLWYFLIESPNIARSWGDYVPLTKSAFRDEVVSLLGEINGYLIAFFRGQLVVSLINGAATGIGLMIVGLDFGLLIGLLLCALGLIPYLGIILCWVPAVVIASVQGGVGTWIPGEPWWVFPLVVTGIFTVVQQIDGLFITPKVVGESVGLHPMTVIVSVFAWSLLMGGLLGAILAVPMTATLKVLLKRYVWEKRIKGEQPRMVTEDTAPISEVHTAEETSPSRTS
jgi:predicted PurR-regulated permease PerM